MEESFSGFCDLEQFRRFERLCVILKSERPMEISGIEQRLERVLARVGRYSDMPMSASLSRVYENSRNFAAMKLILQPIVENCIYHGLKNRIDRGHIRVSAKRDGDYLVLSVRDNGYGMRPEAIDALYRSFQDNAESDSVGLKNIYQRVMIFSHGKAEMIIESVLDEGTTITIKEPVTMS